MSLYLLNHGFGDNADYFILCNRPKQIEGVTAKSKRMHYLLTVDLSILVIWDPKVARQKVNIFAQLHPLGLSVS